MRKTFLFATVIAALPCTAPAIISATDANLGKSCFTDEAGYNLIKCTAAENPVDINCMSTCGGTYAETMHDGGFIQGSGSGFGSGTGLHCIANVSSNSFYLCSQEADMSQTQACKEAVDAARNACLPQLRSFITESNKNRMYSFVHTCSGVNYDGNYTYNLNCNEQKEYGCTEGYYHSGGAQYSDNYTCSLCPTPGTSYAFDEKDTGGITTCYIPAGRTLSDETGSYKFTEDCYYSN